jgi:hypothetical protein
MTVAERIHDFVIAQNSYPFCDDCIQIALGLPRRQEVQPVTKTLGTVEDFRRESGRCMRCGRTKLVVQALGHSKRRQ